MEMQASNYKENKLRWYPQQLQRFIFTNLSEACCETKRWKPFEPVGTWPGPAPKIPQTFSGTFSATCSGTRWTWPGSAPKPPGTFSGTFSGTLLNLTWLCTKASHTFSGTFSGTLLHVTWLCTKASQTFSGTFSETLLNWSGPAQKIPKTFSGTFSATFSGTRWTWLGFAPRLPKSFSGTLLNLTWRLPDLLRNPVEPVEPDLALHPGFLEPSLEFPEPCWTWPVSAPNPRKIRLRIKKIGKNHRITYTKSYTFSGTFGTFSGTSLNLTRCLHQCTGAILGWRPRQLTLLGTNCGPLRWSMLDKICGSSRYSVMENRLRIKKIGKNM